MDIALTFLQTSLEYSSRLYETMNISQHPFGASWSNSSSSNQQTSVFGALPHPNRSPCVLDFTRFQFSCNPDVFNSAVISQQSRRPIFYFTTDSNAPGYTVMRTADKHTLGLVDWRHSRPRVEMHNTMSRRDARDWLRLSNVRNSRTMEVHGHHYTWRPQGDLICLWYAGSEGSMLARISIRENNQVCLDMTNVAMGLNLLESCVFAAFLLSCRRHID